MTEPSASSLLLPDTLLQAEVRDSNGTKINLIDKVILAYLSKSFKANASQGRYSNPTFAVIAKALGLTKRVVQNSIKRLKDSSLIIYTSDFKQGQRNAYTYICNPEDVC